MTGSPTESAAGPIGGSKKSALSGAELRNAQKELASIDRKVAKRQTEIAALHEKLAVHDQSDFAGLGKLSTELGELEESIASFETRWLELSELLGE